MSFFPVLQHCITPVFSVTWSFRNHVNTDLLLNKHFLLLSMLKTVVLLHIFVKTVIHISGFFYKWKVPKLFILNEKKIQWYCIYCYFWWIQLLNSSICADFVVHLWIPMSFKCVKWNSECCTIIGSEGKIHNWSNKHSCSRGCAELQ